MGKILDTLKGRERELRRNNSGQSWASSSIPARFRLRTQQRETFQQEAGKVVAEVKMLEEKNINKCDEEDSAESELLTVMDTKDTTCEADQKDAEVRLRLEAKSSLQSLISSSSLESDWSDEEGEELERMFSDMSARGEELAKIRQVRRSLRNSRRRKAFSPPSMAKLVYCLSRESSVSEITSMGSMQSLDSLVEEGGQGMKNIG